MFKRQTPKESKWTISQFPHCDQRVLHAPGECEFCDKHPAWQALRMAWGIAFTGYEAENGELGCPSEARRPLSIINKWPGNQPSEQSRDREIRDQLEKFKREFERIQAEKSTLKATQE